MENMIETIVNMDQKAREMLAKAEKTQEQARKDIEKRKQELYVNYDESLKEILEMTKSEEKLAVQKGKIKIDQKAETIMRNLDDRFEENKDCWISNIVKEVTGEK